MSTDPADLPQDARDMLGLNGIQDAERKNRMQALREELAQLQAENAAQLDEIAALRRGQGRAPVPAKAGPVPVALHKAHPIPDSTQPGH